VGEVPGIPLKKNNLGSVLFSLKYRLFNLGKYLFDLSNTTSFTTFLVVDYLSVGKGKNDPDQFLAFLNKTLSDLGKDSDDLFVYVVARKSLDDNATWELKYAQLEKLMKRSLYNYQLVYTSQKVSERGSNQSDDYVCLSLAYFFRYNENEVHLYNRGDEYANVKTGDFSVSVGNKVKWFSGVTALNPKSLGFDANQPNGVLVSFRYVPPVVYPAVPQTVPSAVTSAVTSSVYHTVPSTLYTVPTSLPRLLSH
jgi:hypothetical protein